LNESSHLLAAVFQGWEGYNTSLVRAIEPLTPEQLAFTPGGDIQSVGHIAAHIAFGRIDWFKRMGAPGADERDQELHQSLKLSSTHQPNELPRMTADEIIKWLNKSWKMIEDNLNAWTVENLAETYHQPYQGNVYEVSKQWVIWRIMAHDIQHGGQLTILLRLQGIDPPDLSGQGGHIIELPLAVTL
jgi:uncharacterized damage-inducible protein DinB